MREFYLTDKIANSIGSIDADFNCSLKEIKKLLTI